MHCKEGQLLTPHLHRDNGQALLAVVQLVTAQAHPLPCALRQRPALQVIYAIASQA